MLLNFGHQQHPSLARIAIYLKCSYQTYRHHVFKGQGQNVIPFTNAPESTQREELSDLENHVILLYV